MLLIAGLPSESLPQPPTAPPTIRLGLGVLAPPPAATQAVPSESNLEQAEMQLGVEHVPAAANRPRKVLTEATAGAGWAFSALVDEMTSAPDNPDTNYATANVEKLMVVRRASLLVAMRSALQVGHCHLMQDGYLATFGGTRMDANAAVKEYLASNDQLKKTIQTWVTA